MVRMECSSDFYDFTGSLHPANVLEMLPIGACVFTEDLVVREWNQKLEEWTGLSKAEAIGYRLSDHFPNLLESRYSSRLNQVFSTGMPAKYSAALHKHFLPVPVRHGLNGLAGEFMVQETEVRLCSKEPKLAFCTIQDFSFQYGQVGQLKNERADLVATKEKLEQANHRLTSRNEELDEFCYVASHDLQEPLGRLITLGQLLEQNSRSKLDPQDLRCLDGMLGSTRQMRGILIDLLALSRASQMEPNLEPVCVRESASIALELLAKRIDERSAFVDLDMPYNEGDSPIVVADLMLLAKVYQNLVSNSLKFADPDRKPEIHLSAHKEGDWWKLGVTDNGCGIDEAIYDKVFRPFKRLASEEQLNEGSGVGLTICRNAIKRMGGDISIDSTPGKGCSVTFSLMATSASVTNPAYEPGEVSLNED